MSGIVETSGYALTILEVRRENGRGAIALCLCTCGQVKEVLLAHVKSGATKSCGCLRRASSKKSGAANRVHGHLVNGRRTLTYRSWEAMKSRCTNHDDPAFTDYGAVGITFDPKWEEFTGFLQDMGERAPGTSLDRIDGGKGYFKQNCRWATQVIQQRNKRNNRTVVFNGRQQLLIEVAEATGTNYRLLWERIVRLGWSVEKAVATPVRKTLSQS